MPSRNIRRNGGHLKSGGASPHSTRQARDLHLQTRSRFGLRQCSAAFARSASLRLDYIQWNPAFDFAVNLQFEVVISGALKMKTEMLPDVNMCLRLLTRNANLKILADRFEDWPHVRIAEVHFEPVAALLADIESQLTSKRTQGMITGEGMSSDCVK
jgi:hypothetical protein